MAGEEHGAGGTPEAALALRLFQGLLGQAPAPDTLQQLTQALALGESAAELAVAITASPSYAARAAALSDTGFLLHAHRAMFDSAPAPEALQYWLDRLAQGDSRASIAAELADPTAPPLAPHAPPALVETISLGRITLAPDAADHQPITIHGLWDAPAVTEPLVLGAGGIIGLHIHGDGHAAAGWTDATASPGHDHPGEGALVLESLLGLLPGSLATLDPATLRDLPMDSLIHLDPGQTVHLAWTHDEAEASAMAAHHAAGHDFLSGPGAAAPAVTLLTMPADTDWAGSIAIATIPDDHHATPAVAEHDHHTDSTLLG